MGRKEKIIVGAGNSGYRIGKHNCQSPKGGKSGFFTNIDALVQEDLKGEHAINTKEVKEREAALKDPSLLAYIK